MLCTLRFPSVQVTYSQQTARILHNAPLVLICTLMLLPGVVGLASTSKHSPVAAVHKPQSAAVAVARARAAQQAEALRSGTCSSPIVATLLGAVVTAASLLSAMLIAAGAGFLSARTTGVPMVWYGRHQVAAAIYVPAAVSGLLLPYLAWSQKGGPYRIAC